ncbi:hypothetical protein C8R45DRAFT_938775 [Mycena sanguinolenta]|nr:hypothetical protein C8R45DRAFT_938775 [Mycena sanguinolenta]
MHKPALHAKNVTFGKTDSVPNTTQSIMFLTLVLGMNIVATKIKPKPVCLMPSDKRACAPLALRRRACASIPSRYHPLGTDQPLNHPWNDRGVFTGLKDAEAGFERFRLSCYLKWGRVGRKQLSWRNKCLKERYHYWGNLLSATSPYFYAKLTMLARVVPGGDREASHHNTRKPVSRLSEQMGLPSRQTGLQADLPGLGFDLQPNPSPSPNKPVGAGASPFGKPKTSLSQLWEKEGVRNNKSLTEILAWDTLPR